METHKSTWTDPRGPGHDSKESAGGAAAGGDAGGAAAGGGAGGGAKKTREDAHDGTLQSKGTAREEEANAGEADGMAGHAGAGAAVHEDKTHVASQQRQQQHQQQPELVSKRKHPINKRYHDSAVGGMMADPDNIPEAPHRHAPFVKGTVMVMSLASFVSALIWLHYIVRRISDRGGPGGTGNASGGGGGGVRSTGGGGGGGGGRSGGLMRDMTREVGREAAEGAKKTLEKAKETMKSRAGQLGALVSDVKSSKTGADAAAKLTAAIKNADQAPELFVASRFLIALYYFNICADKYSEYVWRFQYWEYTQRFGLRAARGGQEVTPSGIPWLAAGVVAG